jgi:hypothetical protein
MKLMFLILFLSFSSYGAVIKSTGEAQYSTNVEDDVAGYKIATSLALANAAESSKVLVSVDKDLVRTESNTSSRTTTSVITSALMDYKVTSKYKVYESNGVVQYFVSVDASYDEDQQKHIETLISQNDNIASQISSLKLIQDKLATQQINVYKDDVSLYNSQITEIDGWIKEQRRKYLANSVSVVNMQQQASKSIVINQYNAAQKFNELFKEYAKISVSNIKVESLGLDDVVMSYNVNVVINPNDIKRLVNVLINANIVSGEGEMSGGILSLPLEKGLPEYIQLPPSVKYSIWENPTITLPNEKNYTIPQPTYLAVDSSKNMLRIRTSSSFLFSVKMSTAMAKRASERSELLMGYIWK